MRMLAYPDTDIFLITYDMTRLTSLENILGCDLDQPQLEIDEEGSWIGEINSECECDFRVILLGTKHDMWLEKKENTPDDPQLTTVQQAHKASVPLGTRTT